MTVLVGYLDTTLDVIGEEVTGICYGWWDPPGVTGQNNGTPHTKQSWKEPWAVARQDQGQLGE